MRQRGETGTLELSGDEYAVFLDGVVVYARTRELYGSQALDELSEAAGDPSVSPCEESRVRMYTTYMEYIGDDGVLDVEPLDGEAVDVIEVEGVLVQGVGNTPKGTYRGQTNPVDKSTFPSGRLVALAAEFENSKRFAEDHELTGYAVGDGDVVTYRGGEPLDRKTVEIERGVETGLPESGGWVVVDTSNDEGTSDGSGLLGLF